MASSDIGIVGLGTMGENLALNISEKGYNVAVYNRTPERTQGFMRGLGGTSHIVPTFSIHDLTSTLKPPRKILILVKAGAPVDEIVGQISNLLEPGDVLADLGNSHYKDTELRLKDLAGGGVLYGGIGVSGGQEGARRGACFMAGGTVEGYGHLGTILEAAAARTDDGPACGYMGPGGAGHYVKMVHNGIEYAMLEALAESYDIMKKGLNLSNDQIASNFLQWSRGDLESFLLEAASRVCRTIDRETGTHLLDLVEDAAEQKGTGKWCSQDALELGVPTPTIDVAVSQRSLSSFKVLRTKMSRSDVQNGSLVDKQKDVLNQLEDAVLCTFMAAFAQGFSQLREASGAHGYNLNLAEVARVWGGGCIIRAKMVELVKRAYRADGELEHLFLDPGVGSVLREREDAWIDISVLAMKRKIPAPAISTALSYYYSIRSERLPANLIQALRDFFGAHGFRRIDRRGYFHSAWE